MCVCVRVSVCVCVCDRPLFNVVSTCYLFKCQSKLTKLTAQNGSAEEVGRKAKKEEVSEAE